MALVRLTLVTLLLAGCGLAQQAQISQGAHDAQTKRDAAFAACREQFPNKATDRAKCVSAADLEYHFAMQRSVGHPGIDLIQLSHARQIALAEQYDAGKITKAEYNAKSAEIIAETNSLLQARLNNAAVASAAQQQAIAARQQAALQTMTAGAAIMSGGLSTASTPMPTTTSCRPLGGTIHCTHY